VGQQKIASAAQDRYSINCQYYPNMKCKTQVSSINSIEKLLPFLTFPICLGLVAGLLVGSAGGFSSWLLGNTMKSTIRTFLNYLIFSSVALRQRQPLEAKYKPKILLFDI
jgi:hypothetical protein